VYETVYGFCRVKSCKEARAVLDSVAARLCGEAHVVVSSVDVSQEGSLASQHKISKFPSVVVSMLLVACTKNRFIGCVEFMWWQR
jgi:hypothetical protein